jgi:hypothetical protein
MVYCLMAYMFDANLKMTGVGIAGMQVLKI